MSKTMNRVKKNYTKPHDTLFKEYFKDSEKIQAIIKLTVPEVYDILNLETLRTDNQELSTDGLLTSLPDLLFQCELKESSYPCVFILVEHKSYHDKFVVIQLLKYMALIWDNYKNKTKEQNQRKIQLPFIIPLVFYHGSKEWKTFSLLDLFPKDSSLLKYIPNFTLPICNLKEVPDEKLFENVKEHFMLILLKSLFSEDDKEVNIYLAKFFNEQGKKLVQLDFEYVFKLFINYLNQVRPNINIKTINEELMKLSGGNMSGLTFREQVVEFYEENIPLNEQKGFILGEQKGFILGEEKGKREGIREGKLNTAKSFLDILDEQTIADKTGLSLEEVQKLKEV